MWKELYPTSMQNEIRAINVLSTEEAINSMEVTGFSRREEHLSGALQNKWILQAGKGKEGK